MVGRSRTAAVAFVVALGLASCGTGSPAPATSSPAGRPTTVAIPSASAAGQGPSASTASTGTSPTATPEASIVTTKKVGERVVDIVVRSPAVGAEVPVRLLLPARFSRERSRTWPVLYLLHGCCDSYVSWTRSTDIERLTRNRDVLVVMPDGGRVGFYADWLRGSRWETFHLVELPKLLREQYRAGGRRAVVGVSMGGLGALDYAARHPGMFRLAASFSGIVHTRFSADTSDDYVGLVQSEGEDGLGLWGDPRTDAAVWRAHNPYDLAPRLRGTKLVIAAGDGDAGPLDRPGTAPDPIEATLGSQNKAFARRVRALNLDATIDLYGNGTHNWVYWQRELHRAWPAITSALGVR